MKGILRIKNVGKVDPRLMAILWIQPRRCFSHFILV